MESFPQRSRMSARRLRDPCNWTEVRSTNNWVRNSQISPFRHKWGQNNILFWSAVPSTTEHFYALTRPPNCKSRLCRHSVTSSTPPHSRHTSCSPLLTARVSQRNWNSYTIPRAAFPKYRVIRNDCRGSNNLSYTFSRCKPHVVSFYGVTSRIRFMFLLFPQLSRYWRYESEPPLKPSPLTCYKQFGTNSIIVLMSVESQRVPI